MPAPGIHSPLFLQRLSHSYLSAFELCYIYWKFMAGSSFLLRSCPRSHLHRGHPRPPTLRKCLPQPLSHLVLLPQYYLSQSKHALIIYCCLLPVLLPHVNSSPGDLVCLFTVLPVLQRMPDIERCSVKKKSLVTFNYRPTNPQHFSQKSKKFHSWEKCL